MSRDRKIVVQTGKEILDRGLVAGTWGNVSKRLEEDQNKFAITPSGMNYKEIEEKDVVILNLDGERIEGGRKSSTEYRLHQHIYRSKEDVNAIVHTHSAYASAIACARRNIPPIVEDMVQVVGGSVETAEYKLPGTDELAKAGLEALGDKKAALLANHGVISIAEDMDEALKVSEIVEKSAKIYLFSHLIGVPEELSGEDVQKMRDMYSNYGQK